MKIKNITLNTKIKFNDLKIIYKHNIFNHKFYKIKLENIIDCKNFVVFIKIFQSTGIIFILI